MHLGYVFIEVLMRGEIRMTERRCSERGSVPVEGQITAEIPMLVLLVNPDGIVAVEISGPATVIQKLCGHSTEVQTRFGTIAQKIVQSGTGS